MFKWDPVFNQSIIFEMIFAKRLGTLLRPVRRPLFNFAAEVEKPKAKGLKPQKAASTE